MHTAVLQSMALPDEFIALLLVMVIPLQHVASKGTRGLTTQSYRYIPYVPQVMPTYKS